MVLSSQRVDLKDAPYNALKEKDRAETSNPLVMDGQKLIPSVTRVFRRLRDLFASLQAYEPGAETVQPLVAFVTFYRGQSKAFETQPMQVSDGPVIIRAKLLSLTRRRRRRRSGGRRLW